MNISLCAEENFVMSAMFCLTSVFENNQEVKMSIHISLSVLAKRLWR